MTFFNAVADQSAVFHYCGLGVVNIWPLNVAIYSHASLNDGDTF